MVCGLRPLCMLGRLSFRAHFRFTSASEVGMNCGIYVNMIFTALLMCLKEAKRETFSCRYKGKTAALDVSC